MNKLLFIILTACMLISINCISQKPKWKKLFNGKDLNDWKIKISRHELGNNYNNTFRVEDGLLRVVYENYGDFKMQYGHIFYKQPFHSYILNVEYRFVGEQVTGGEGWAWRNSGLMLHCQDPETMNLDQKFPISIEVQLLGGNGTAERPTANLCTPGTHVKIKDTLFTTHCINSGSKTYHGDQWVKVQIIVLGDSLFRHIVDNNVVLEYTAARIGGGPADDYDSLVKKDGMPLSSGYIALQSESHPVEFRKVEIFDLGPYMDQPKKMNRLIRKRTGSRIRSI